MRERPIPSRAEAAIRQAYELFDRYSELSPKNASAEMLMNIMSSEDAGYIADFLAQNVSMRVLDKQSILDELRPVQRLNKMNRLLRREVEILEMEQSIQRRVPGEHDPEPKGRLSAGAGAGDPGGAGRGRRQ